MPSTSQLSLSSSRALEVASASSSGNLGSSIIRLRRLRRPASRALRFFSSVLLSYLRRRLISCSTPARITSRRNLRKMDSSPSFSSTRICTLNPLAATTAVGARRATCTTDGGELFPENGASGSCSSVLSRELVAGAAMAAGLLRVRGSRFCVLG
uniref:Uncharacterized protein n=1 Tax=Zea mays TaxID=4577 RepID=C0P6M9_MAIZE|nr:unknown [Zea mays]